LSRLQCHARHADPPDAAHQRFTAQRVWRDKVCQMAGETLRDGAGLLQALDGTDLGVFAADTPEAPPERSIIRAGPLCPFSSELAVSTRHGARPIYMG
jgi:hypothetical protein